MLHATTRDLPKEDGCRRGTWTDEESFSSEANVLVTILMVVLLVRFGDCPAFAGDGPGPRARRHFGHRSPM